MQKREYQTGNRNITGVETKCVVHLNLCREKLFQTEELLDKISVEKQLYGVQLLEMEKYWKEVLEIQEAKRSSGVKFLEARLTQLSCSNDKQRLHLELFD